METKIEKISNSSMLPTQACETQIFSKSQRVVKNAEIHKQKIFKDFCQSTSLHGYSYLYNTNSLALRIVWICVILIMTYLGITFLVNNTNAYLKSTIVTSIETSSASLSVSLLKIPRALLFVVSLLYLLLFRYLKHGSLSAACFLSKISGRPKIFWA